MGRYKDGEFKKLIVIYYCHKCQKDKQKELSEHEISGWENECGCCGSHGGIRLEFKCDCGKQNNFSIGSW